ncbi:uncharacterized protein LOC131159272 isoform X2 [Malania oleifera]|uniref:uncharacterized protein LOC131159272 isoform X2 n=1 Tax=Malania oleifera TaxID=397392 RepID=UPI0025AE9F82|nr:uncharacterized protein LOC131159272 isoform X2 [Malania oleifera]XP_057970004.1 uncharacterized protein LOC131159272 isoform X2 [Malania oleifera]
MKSRANGIPRAQRSKNFQGEGPNWVLIAGSALLSTLSIRLGYKLKQIFDTKQQENANHRLKGTGKSMDRRKLGGCHMHSNVCSFAPYEDGCFNCTSGNEEIAEIKFPHNGQISIESDVALPLVTVPTLEFSKESGIIWASSPDCLELPPKPFHHSNSSDSPSVSECGSDIFSKREVIHKLRQQLKKRDDMIQEMHDQIAELQNSLETQMSHSAHLQSLLDAGNRDLFDSEREIQMLRKAIADHCLEHVNSNDKPSTGTIWPSEGRNGHANGYLNGDRNLESLEKWRADGEKIEKLKRDVGDLKEVIEGKDYLLRSYKEQTAELSMKIKELQQRLDSQLPNIL